MLNSLSILTERLKSISVTKSPGGRRAFGLLHSCFPPTVLLKQGKQYQVPGENNRINISRFMTVLSSHSTSFILTYV